MALLAGLCPAAGASAGWRFEADPGVRLGEDVNAASPEAEGFAGGTVRLYVPGVRVYRSADGLTFEAEVASAPAGTDTAIVTAAPGLLRMYFVRQTGAGPLQGGQKQLYSAVSGDGIAWTEEPGLRYADVGNGVPDVVELPGGGYRLYYVALPTSPGGEEGVVSAMSDDGLAFHAEKGRRFPVPYVDPEVARLGSGNWLGAVSTFAQGTRQTLHLAESFDGLEWHVDPEPLVSGERNFLDPSLLALGPRRYRIYYSVSSPQNGGPGGGPFRVESGVIRATEPEVSLRMRSRSLERVRRKERLAARLEVSEPADVQLSARARGVVVARAEERFPEPGGERVALELRRAGERALRGGERARVSVRADATSIPGLSVRVRDARLLG